MSKLMSILLTIFVLNSLQGQGVFSIDAGIINSKVRFENLDQAKPSDINNYYISFGFGQRFSDKLEIIADIRYATKGYDMRTGDDQLDIKVFNFDYLSLAPKLLYRPIPMLSLVTGISIDQKLRERSRDAGFNTGTWHKIDSIKNTDLNFLLGATVHYQFMYFKLMLENGVLNLNDLIYTDQNGNPIPDVSLKNKSISLGIGFYLFG